MTFQKGFKHSEETKKKISKAKKGNLNPAKRLDVRAKISKTLTGKKQSQETVEKRSASQRKHKPWKRGWKLSDETRQKMSLSKKGKKPAYLETTDKETISEISRNRQKKLWTNPEYRKNQIEKHTGKNSYNYGKHHSKETRDKISDSLMGENHPGWQGGKGFEPYCPKFNEALKERIRERDNRTCQLCRKKENGRRLSVHHVHYDKPECDPDLIAICASCHSKTGQNRDYYEGLFMDILTERGLLCFQQ